MSELGNKRCSSLPVSDSFRKELVSFDFVCNNRDKRGRTMLVFDGKITLSVVEVTDETDFVERPKGTTASHDFVPTGHESSKGGSSGGLPEMWLKILEGGGKQGRRVDAGRFECKRGYFWFTPMTTLPPAAMWTKEKGTFTRWQEPGLRLKWAESPTSVRTHSLW